MVVGFGRYIEGGFIVCLDGRGCFGISNVIFVAFNIDGIGG